MQNAEKLRELIQQDELLMLPGCYDGITANLIKKSGFQAAYISGAGVSFSLLGRPDLNLVSYLELKQKIDILCPLLGIPTIVDIDAGFGGPLNIMRLIDDFDRAGVAGVQIEDQASPKKCGHVLGRSVVSIEEMCQRIRTIKDQRPRGENGMVIVARTDSRTILGIDEAIRRGNAYYEAGADAIFVESPETLEEVERIGREIKGPTLFNNIEGGRSPFVGKAELEKYGFKLAIYPNSLARAIIPTGLELLKTISETGSTEAMWPQMIKHKAMFSLFDFERLVEEEGKYRIQ